MSAKTIEPHKGPQTKFLSSRADIAIYGGQAGGGKSWALLVDGARNIDNPKYHAVIFRRTSPQITNAGGLWDESLNIYPLLTNKSPKTGDLEWHFDSGAKILFRHLQHASDARSWQGSAIAYLAFDELTHFEESQFWYLMSRNRSTCGIRPYIRATTNPVPADDPTGGWVRRLIDWWINPVTGIAIPERSGVLRWFVRVNNELHWADSADELIIKFDGMKDVVPKSLTFIPAKLEDNPTMAKLDPNYRGNLLALPDVERKRLLEGNWNIKAQAGMFYKVGKLEIIDTLPAGLKYCRAWDLAATDGAGDWTVGAKIGKDKNGFFYIADIVRGQWESSHRDNQILNCAKTDGRCTIRLPQDPGAAGKSDGQRLVRMLAGYSVKLLSVRGDKETRGSGFASQLNAGNVRMLRAPWNAALTQELDGFPTKGYADDQCDACADAAAELMAKQQIVIGIGEDDEEPKAQNRYQSMIEEDDSDLVVMPLPPDGRRTVFIGI